MQKTKLLWMIIALLCMGLFSACWPAPAAILTPTATPVQETSILKTMLGELAVKSARLTAEAHGQSAQPGEAYLLVTLAKPDLTDLTPETFPLESFQRMVQANPEQIFVDYPEGEHIPLTMAGWVDDAFVMGFVVPEGSAYTLHWPDNAPLALSVAGE